MTDKEWKELCKWVKNEYDFECLDDCFCFRGLCFEKDGTISLVYYQDFIVGNRTPSQIRAIIENLL